MNPVFFAKEAIGSMTTNLNVGNVVRLRGDSREMIILQLASHGQVLCLWFTGTDVTSSDWFVSSQLELIDNSSPPEVAFEPGDTVQLPIYGPPSMTVVKVEKDEVECVWFSSFNLHSNRFDVRMLNLIRKNDDKVGVDRGPMTGHFKTRMLWLRTKTQDKTAWFEAGDEVQLRSGGPVMTVTDGGSGRICCSDSEGLVTFDAPTLQLVSVPKSEQTIETELIALARKNGIDLDSLWGHYAFSAKNRCIWFWQKTRKGAVYYNLQGSISVLPEVLKGSESAFRGVWTEAGCLENINHAFTFLKGWLIDLKEVDELPKRYTIRYQI
jgi:uncharacterized protein YodC (DUF2158 family)